MKRFAAKEARALGERLKSARLERGLTLQQMAAKLSTDHGSLSKIEGGKFVFLNNSVQKMCKSLRVKVECQSPPSEQLRVRVEQLLASEAGGRALCAFLDAIDEGRGGPR